MGLEGSREERYAAHKRATEVAYLEAVPSSPVSRLLEWRDAVHEDRAALMSFTCTEPPLCRRVPPDGYEHDRRWELVVQRYIRDVHPPYRPAVKVWVGYDDEGLGAVAAVEELHSAANVSVMLTATCAPQGGGYADDKMEFVFADLEGGYVVLLNRAGQAAFAARAGDVFPAKRGTSQSGLLESAARGVVVRGVTRLDLGSGTSTPELNTESAVAQTCVVAVMFDGPAPWMRFSAGRKMYGSPGEGWCDHCSAAFTSYRPTCDLCGDLHCPTCGDCSWEDQPVAGERVCATCFTLQLPAAYENAQATSAAVARSRMVRTDRRV